MPNYGYEDLKKSKDMNDVYQLPPQAMLPITPVSNLKRSRSWGDFQKITTCITGSSIQYSRISLPVRWYQIQTVDKNGKIQRVQRRYNEFAALQ